VVSLRSKFDGILELKAMRDLNAIFYNNLIESDWLKIQSS